MSSILGIWLVALCSVLGHALSQEKTSSQNNNSSLQVDLGYASYRGHPDGTTGLNAWLGIQYAAPPTGHLRWRAPQSPTVSLSNIINANKSGPACPQTPPAPGSDKFAYQGNEDCLYLDVFAPEGAVDLPVLVNIHGGGYGLGSGQQNFTQLSVINDYGFVAVSIQYRLGALGFLAGSAVESDGDLNVGLLDQHFAMEWVQEHIHKFGGDARKVTIEGLSAGAGSVLLQAVAYGGSEGTRLFRNGIASSPFEPAMYHYSDPIPEENFLKLAEAADCHSNIAARSELTNKSTILDCLRQTDTDLLQYANSKVGSSGIYGSWVFQPVVDDTFVQQLPSEQLLAGKVNGLNLLTSHNSNDGAQYVSPNTTDFVEWLRSAYPSLTPADINQIDQVHYPAGNISSKFATCGDCGAATMINAGPFATGDLQRAIAFYTEVTLACPSYFLASAFHSSAGQTSFKYQFSVVPGYHGMDTLAESLVDSSIIPQANTIGPDLRLALTTVWGNMIKTGNPSISNSLANGNGTTTTEDTGENPISQWPAFTLQGKESWRMIDLNQTGGVEFEGLTLLAKLPAARQYKGPGLRNSFREVDAYGWEGGQGERCEFLRSIGRRIPF